MIAILDLDLTPLAALPTDHAGLEGKSVEPIVLAGGERAAFVRTNDALCGFVVERAPRSPWPWALLVLLATIGTVTGVPCTRRRISSSIRRVLIPAADREAVLDDVLTELSTAGHGKLAVTATIRRMRDQLTMLSGLDEPPPQQFGERLGEAVQNVRDVGLPKALAIAGNVEGVGIAPDRVTSLRRGIRAVSELTRALPAGVPYGRAARTLARGLDEATDLVETSLTAIRAACRYEMSCDVVAEIRRAVGARRSEMIERGIELVAPAVSRLEGSRVFGTSTEVSFILENLIANAIEAVGESPAGRISISAESADESVVVAVTDTGRGVPTADRERIFERGFSQKPGGGHGLWRSRDILMSREGSIQLVDSAPGRGSRFEVRFALCGR